MNPWITFAVWLLSLVVTALVFRTLGYNKGRYDEARDWRDPE